MPEGPDPRRPDAPESVSPKPRGFLLPIMGGGLALWAVHAAWLNLDSRPPVWDMAMHQVFALNYLPGFVSIPGARIWELSSTYPPLVHLIIALAYILFHPGPHVAVLANIPATFLLLWAIHDLGFRLAGPKAGLWACILMLLTPYLIWMSRETILDYWLSAWVAAAWALLLRSHGFESRKWSLLLGISCAAGMLTKWFFAGFVAIPIMHEFFVHRVWRDGKRLVHAADALILCGLAAGVWYVPNIPRLVRYFSMNASIGAMEGEPPVFSFQSLIYYLRLLEGYQLFALLFVVLLIGIGYSVWRGAINQSSFLWLSIAGGWLVMTLLRTKDPRFTMPLLGPLLIPAGVCLNALGRSVAGKALRAVLMLLLLFQAYAINFGIAWLPREVVLLKGYQGSLRWDWNLYLQHYFGILGAPQLENWRQSEILDLLASDAVKRGASLSLGLVPDLPRFNAANFLLQAWLRRYPMRVDHPQGGKGLASFEGFDYVLMTEREQGMPWTTLRSRTLNQYIMDERSIFRLVGLFGLPNGDAARLYYIDRKSAARE